MQTTIWGGVGFLVLLLFLGLWFKWIKPKITKRREDREKLEAKLLRQAQLAKDRALMEHILELLSTKPVKIEEILSALELSVGPHFSPSDVSKALKWELSRQTRCRISVKPEKGFCLKENDKANSEQ